MAVDIVARAMAANASGGEISSDYNKATNKPHINGVVLEGNKTAQNLGINDITIIDARGETKVDLDKYTTEGLYIIKGVNLEQVSLTTGFNFMYVSGTTQWIVEGHFTVDNYILRQIVIKRTIGETSSTSYNVPSCISQTYTRNPNQYESFSTLGAYNLYGELKNSIGYSTSSRSLSTLANLTTEDKSSLIGAINEVYTKATNPCLVINLTEDTEEGFYTADKTYEEIKSAYDDRKTLVISIGNSRLPMLNAEIANDGSMGITFGYTNLVAGGQIVTTRAIHYLYTADNEIWQDADETSEFAQRSYVDELYTQLNGYDGTKTQVLKNINGTLTWVDEN